MANVLLFQLAVQTDPGFNNGLALMSSFLKAANHRVRLIMYDNDKAWYYRDGDFMPDVVGLSVTNPQRELAFELSEKLKVRYPNAIQVIGGVDVILNPSDYWYTDADVLCIGEGELGLTALVNNDPDPPNMWFRDKAKPTPSLLDLSNVPIEDYSIFKWKELMDRRNGWIGEFFTGRGCPYQCSYCSNAAIARALSATSKAYVRHKPVWNVIKEIMWGIANYSETQVIVLGDDNFTLDLSYLAKFLDLYRKIVGLPFVCNVRPEQFDLEIAQSLKSAGCIQVKLGIESGNQELRTHILNRRMSNEDIENAFDAAHRAGLETSAFLMIGLPIETPEMIQDTIRLVAKIKPKRFKFSIFYPFSGTPLAKFCSANGLINEEKKKHLTNYYSDTCLIMDPITESVVKTTMSDIAGAVNAVIGQELYHNRYRSYMAVRE